MRPPNSKIFSVFSICWKGDTGSQCSSLLRVSHQYTPGIRPGEYQGRRAQDIHLGWRVMYEHHGITQDYMRQHSNMQAVLWRSPWACSEGPGITGGRSGSSRLLRVSGRGQGSYKSCNIGSFGSLVYCARRVLAPGPLLFHQKWLLKDSTASPPDGTHWPNSLKSLSLGRWFCLI